LWIHSYRKKIRNDNSKKAGFVKQNYKYIKKICIDSLKITPVHFGRNLFKSIFCVDPNNVTTNDISDFNKVDMKSFITKVEKLQLNGSHIVEAANEVGFEIGDDINSFSDENTDESKSESNDNVSMNETESDITHNVSRVQTHTRSRRPGSKTNFSQFTETNERVDSDSKRQRLNSKHRRRKSKQAN